jgi:hypothetical protein
MLLYLFQMGDRQLLDPNLSIDSPAYRQRIRELAQETLAFLKTDTGLRVDVPPVQLDDIATLHCDKWIEGTALHMSLYASTQKAPVLQSSNATPYSTLPIVTYKAFSGDASGVIGEALFVFTLTEHLGLDISDLTHLGASKSTGIFPDFGVHALSSGLRDSFAAYGIAAAQDLARNHLIPAEVKSMSNPTSTIVRERLDKAVRQLRSFWRMYASGVDRGASTIYMALRNPDRAAYSGVTIWMK